MHFLSHTSQVRLAVCLATQPHISFSAVLNVSMTSEIKCRNKTLDKMGNEKRFQPEARDSATAQQDVHISRPITDRWGCRGSMTWMTIWQLYDLLQIEGCKANEGRNK